MKETVSLAYLNRLLAALPPGAEIELRCTGFPPERFLTRDMPGEDRRLTNLDFGGMWSLPLPDDAYIEAFRVLQLDGYVESQRPCPSVESGGNEMDDLTPSATATEARAALTALVIPADSSQPARVVTEEIDLAYLQYVVGGLIEPIDLTRVLTDNGPLRVTATVFVNEEGKLAGLPLNSRATDLCAFRIGGWECDVVVGDVIVTGQPDDDGENTGCPAKLINIVRNWGWLS